MALPSSNTGTSYTSAEEPLYVVNHFGANLTCYFYEKHARFLQRDHAEQDVLYSDLELGRVFGVQKNPINHIDLFNIATKNDHKGLWTLADEKMEGLDTTLYSWLLTRVQPSGGRTTPLDSRKYLNEVQRRLQLVAGKKYLLIPWTDKEEDKTGFLFVEKTGLLSRKKAIMVDITLGLVPSWNARILDDGYSEIYGQVKAALSDIESLPFDKE